MSKALRKGFPLLVGGILILPTILSAQTGLSHVRVVRLSYVSGTVGVKRPASTEWAKAQVNTPIQEGFELSTSAGSYAEVEFENGSTARLGELSRVNFQQLAMDQDGNKVNRLAFEQGYATFHFLPEHQDVYSVKIAEAMLTPNGKCEFRTDLDRDRVRVEVFSGSVVVAASAKTVKLGKDKVLEFNPAAPELALNEKSGLVKDSWDKWTSERDTQTELSLNDQAVGARGPMYGWSDLNAYGEWGYFPGFGYGWSPFASAGWMPYSMGMWSWYPNVGYAWISGEPWGWLPYHYGNWNFSPGFGWFWMPGMFGNFSPALVSWYSGPGWMGWSPLGTRNMMTTAPGNVVQNGLMVNPQNTTLVPVSAGTAMTHMPLEPGAGARLSGTPLANAEALFTPHAGAVHTTAPASILMGGDPAKEQANHGFHLTAREPLRVRMGNTLGGAFAVGGTLGEFRGDAFKGGPGIVTPNGMPGRQFSRGSGPVILAHGQQASGEGRQGGSGTPSGMGSIGPTSSGSTMSNSSSVGHSAAPTAAPSGGGGHH
jgi:hypothetical protein